MGLFEVLKLGGVGALAAAIGTCCLLGASMKELTAELPAAYLIGSGIAGWLLALVLFYFAYRVATRRTDKD